MSFGEKILNYKEDILRDLNTLISIRSISGQNDSECERALDFIMSKAEEFGLIKDKTASNCGHVQLGEGGKLCSVLTHLDVVPAGKGWTFEPFALTSKDGKYYGRGVADDKAFALISLYCLKALKDSGVEGKNTLRTIFGTDEEVGMSDMKTYFEHNPLPDMAFTPDSDYGICIGEKGILQVEISLARHDGTTLTELSGGNAINAVPDTAWALLDASENDDHQLLRLADARQGNFEFKYIIDGMMIISHGISAHACQPDLGKNAITELVALLCSHYDLKSMGKICGFINYKIGTETNGVSLGLKMRDAASGELTVNVGTISIGEHQASATLDIRYPVTVNGQDIIDRVFSAAKYEGLKFRIIKHEKPVYFEKESPLVKLLSEAYESIMGEKPNLYTTGGGTYAKTLGGKGLAFGGVFPGDNCGLHQANESIDGEKLFLHAQICLEAMYRMYTDCNGD